MAGDSLGGVEDERPLHERLIELAVFVPVGVATSLAEELPALAEKGREQVDKQIQLARVMGRIAVRQAKKRLRSMSPAAPSHPAPPPTESTASQGAAEPAEGSPTVTESAGSSGESATADGPDEADEGYGGELAPRPDAPDASTLAIPAYDTLAASQVVQRLSSLRPDELEAIRRYESATRQRRTILHRVAQLGSDDGRATA